MQELFRKADALNKKYQYASKERVAQELLSEYKNIPFDIMLWFFVRHSWQGDEIIQGFENFNIKNSKFYIEELNNDKLQDKNIIDYAPFANYSAPYIVESDDTVDWYKFDYFKLGTWDYPIVAIKQNGKLLVIDGTNRFRHMLICLKNNFNFIKENHLINIIEEYN